MVEPPYGIIWNRLKAGKVVPFLGAGASFVGRTADAKWNAATPAFLPSGVELANFLAKEAELPSTDSHDLDDLAKVCSYYSISGRPILRERLRDLFNHSFPIGPLHEFLASIPASLVITVTNYDTLVEQAFQAAGKPYDLVIYPTDRKDIANGIIWWPHGEAQPVVRAPNELDIDLAKTTVIYKMHGTVHPDAAEWDSFVVTEEDYVEFLSRMTLNTAVPSIFSQYFRERSFLFLGYSLRDWNLRVVLKNLSKYFAARREGDDDVLPAWSIQRSPSDLDKKLWSKRNVEIYELTVDEFVEKMRERQGASS